MCQREVLKQRNQSLQSVLKTKRKTET